MLAWYKVTNMEITRTARVKIGLPVEVAETFIAAYTAACQFASDVAFTLKRPSDIKELNTRCYGAIREKFNLSAQVTCSCLRVVVGRYSALKVLKRPPTKPVVFTGEPVSLQGGERGRDFSFTKKGLISLTTLEGRAKVSFEGPPTLPTFIKDWTLGGALLQVKDGAVYLLISFDKEVAEVTAPNNAVVGGDRGINNLLIGTDGKKQVFFGGGHVLHRKRHYQDVRASIQSQKAKRPTRSIRRLLKRLGDREARFMKNTDHVVSKQFVAFAANCGSPVIALEGLGGIRESSLDKGKWFRREIHRWSYFRLELYITYKANDLGFTVMPVDAAYTSQGCSRCGYIAKANRKGNQFHCQACHYQLHADLNAARNIRLRCILARQARAGMGPLSVAPKVPSLLGTSPLHSSNELGGGN